MGKNLIIILLVLVLGVVLGVWITRELSNRRKKDRLSLSFIQSRLSNCSDLTTCNLEYVGLVKYENGTIPLLSRKSFSMVYGANVRAGIDLSKARVSVNNSEVRVVLPPSEIQSIDVDTSSLKFYDEHFALFNWDRREDINTAVQAARKDVEENANLDGLKQQAHNQAEMVVYKLLEPVTGKDRRLIIDNDLVNTAGGAEIPVELLYGRRDAEKAEARRMN